MNVKLIQAFIGAIQGATNMPGLRLALGGCLGGGLIGWLAQMKGFAALTDDL